MHRKQSGFTIVELVVVIILLGILAATALPRFINIDDDAYDAAFSAAQGGMQTGVSMFHAQWIAEGQVAADTQLPDFNNLRTNDDGYPYGLVDNSGGSSDVTTSTDCTDVFANVMQSGAPSVSAVANLAAVPTATTDFAALVSGTPDCTYYHTAAGTNSGDVIGTLTYNPANGDVAAGTYSIP